MATIKLVGVAALATAACLDLAGCGGGHSTRGSDPKSLPKPIPTPSLPQQVRRAERIGPGFLDYCPTHNGRARARFDVDIPGNPVAPGWCATTARRGRLKDVVTFRAHWDARRVTGASGTMIFTYSVPNAPVPGATPSAVLVGQSGQLPP